MRTFAQPFPRTASRTKTSAQRYCVPGPTLKIKLRAHSVRGTQRPRRTTTPSRPLAQRNSVFCFFTCPSKPTFIAFSSLGTHAQSTTGNSKCKRDVLAVCAAVHARGKVRTVPAMFGVKHHAEEETEWAPCNSSLPTAELPEPSTRSAALCQTASAQEW